jgi:hypothetical protein
MGQNILNASYERWEDGGKLGGSIIGNCRD